MAPEQRKQGGGKTGNSDTRKSSSNRGGSETDRPNRRGMEGEEEDDRETREGREKDRSEGSSRE
jgi:hypothetical protein